MPGFLSLLFDRFVSGGPRAAWGPVSRAIDISAGGFLERGSAGSQLLGRTLKTMADEGYAAAGTYEPLMDLPALRAVPEAKRRAIGLDFNKRTLRIMPEAELAAKQAADPQYALFRQTNDRIFGHQAGHIMNTTPYGGGAVQTMDPATGLSHDFRPWTDFFTHLQSDKSITLPLRDTLANVETLAQRHAAQQAGRPLTDPEIAALHNVVNTQIMSVVNGQPPPSFPPDLIKAINPAMPRLRELVTYYRNFSGWASGRVPEEARLFGSSNPDEAGKGLGILRNWLSNDFAQASKLGQIHYSRSLNLPPHWYETDPLKIWGSSIVRVERKLAELRHFGNSNERFFGQGGIRELIRDDFERARAEKTFNRVMGVRTHNEQMLIDRKILDKIFGLEVTTKLGLSQISQIGQVLNSVLETDLTSTLQSISRLGWSRQVAARSGATVDQLSHMLGVDFGQMSEQDFGRRASEWFLRRSGFTYFDLLSRQVAAGSGWLYGEKMLWRVLRNPADRFARRELERFGLVADDLISRGQGVARERLPEVFGDDLLTIARRASHSANFTSSALEIPLSMSHPVGRAIFLFKNFGMRQLNFMTRRVVDELFAGNPAPFLRLAFVGGVGGEALTLAKDLASGRWNEHAQELQQAGHDPQVVLSRAAQNIMASGAFGIFDQLVKTLQFGQRGLLEFITGPVISDATEVLTDLYGATLSGDAAARKTGRRSLARFAARQVPVAGPILSRAVRVAQEPVTRLPSGTVLTQRGRRPIGREEPGSLVPGIGASLPVALGLSPDVSRVRTAALGEIRASLQSGNRAALPDIIKRAREQGANISASDVNRLVREIRQGQAA